MSFNKDHLRKIYGLPPPNEDGDPSVIARRKYHESAAKWCVKWLTSIYTFSGLLGFFVILLPVLFKPWRLIIESIPIVSQIFHSYSSLSGFSMVNFLVMMILFFAKSFFRKNIPGNQMHSLTYEAVIHMDLYPKARREEVAYWVNIIFHVAGSSIWLFLPFGVLAYFILIRG